MISIIIPVLNEASTISATLEHVTSLIGDYEVIVVDGDSSDGTASIAKGFAKVVQGPRGRARQMNAGAGGASGAILLFVHADARLPGQAISAVEQVMSDPGVVGGHFKLRLGNPGLIYRLISFAVNMRDRWLGGFTGDQAIFVRADSFRALDGYRDMPLMEDLDFGKRMSRAGKVVTLPLTVTTSSRRWEKDGIAKTILLMWALRLLYALGCPPATLKRFYGETR